MADVKKVRNTDLKSNACLCITGMRMLHRTKGVICWLPLSHTAFHLRALTVRICKQKSGL